MLMEGKGSEVCAYRDTTDNSQDSFQSAPQRDFFRHRVPGWDLGPKFWGRFQALVGGMDPRSHLLLVSGLCKAGPAPSEKGKEAVGRDGQSAHRGSLFLLSPKSTSRGGLPETLEEPQDASPGMQEGPVTAEIPSGSHELVSTAGHQAVSGGDPRPRSQSW